jgi:hypothetical protein
VLLELALELGEQRERVGGRAGEAREHAIVVNLAHLAGARLYDCLADRHLPVAGERDPAAMAHGDDRRRMEAAHLAGHRIPRPTSQHRRIAIDLGKSHRWALV